MAVVSSYMLCTHANQIPNTLTAAIIRFTRSPVRMYVIRDSSLRLCSFSDCKRPTSHDVSETSIWEHMTVLWCSAHAPSTPRFSTISSISDATEMKRWLFDWRESQ